MARPRKKPKLRRITDLSIEERAQIARTEGPVRAFMASCTVSFAKKGERLPFGAGTLVRLDAELLVATASHVAQAVYALGRDAMILFCGEGNQVEAAPLENVTHQSKPFAWENYEKGRPDVALIRLKTDLRIGGMNPIAAAAIRQGAKPRPVRDTVITGVPREFAEAQADETAVHLLALHTHIKKCTSRRSHGEDSGRDPRRDIHVDWSNANWKPRSEYGPVFDARGFSGGGLWLFKRMPRREVWAVEKSAKLAGILWLTQPRAKCIRAIPIQCWLELVRKTLSLNVGV